MKEYKFIIKRGITDGNERQLIMNESFISFENKDYIHDAFTTIDKDEIVALKYGIKWISFYLTFGREYQFFIKLKNNKELKINFTTYFGKNKIAYHELYADILNALWELYFSKIADEFLSQFYQNEKITIANLEFHKEGIRLKKGVSDFFEIPWNEVRTANYQRNFVVYSNQNPQKLNKSFNYHEDWNAMVLFSVLRGILQEKGIESYN